MSHTINSTRSKFAHSKEKIKDIIDVGLTLDTKLDDTFPVGQFHIDGYSTPYHLDRTSHDGGFFSRFEQKFLLK